MTPAHSGIIFEVYGTCHKTQNAMNPYIEIAIAEDQKLLCEALVRILDAEPDFKIVIRAANGWELLQKLECAHASPHVLLLDIEMPVMNGIETLSHLRRKYGTIKVIMLSLHADTSIVNRCLKLGACSYIPKGCDCEALIDTVRNVYHKDRYISWQASSLLNTGDEGLRKADAVFSSTELRVLRALQAGAQTKQIAARLFLSPRTVEGIRQRLYKKTGTRTPASLLNYVLKTNLLKDTDE